VGVFFPMFSTGLVFIQERDERWRISGTSAAYNSRHSYVTAAHCVPDGCDVAVHAIKGSGGNMIRPAQAVTKHPETDIAVITLDPAEDGTASHLRECIYVRPADQLIDGGDFIGHGYPVEGAEAPVARTFKGHFMRYFGYEPPNGGNSYFAGEMSIPAPPGFSGGPLAYTTMPNGLVAVVTTNVDSEIILDRFEEVQRDGSKHAERVTRMISYGIAAMTAGHWDWLDQHAPSA
jgi:Trypsin-like peptidase domain